jgi:hypothetical protein
MEIKHKYVNRKLSGITVSFLVFALTFVNVGISAPAGNPPPEPPPPVKAILRTTDNRPISVNGSNSSSGATVLTGSIIETPDQVGAVISLAPAADLELEPNTKIQLDFDENGNMKVTVVRGCATARTKKNVIAQFETEQGVAGTTDPKKRKNMTVCYPPGSTVPIITFPIPAGAAAAGGHGLFYVLVAAISTGLITTGVVLRGDNPSPSGL